MNYFTFSMGVMCIGAAWLEVSEAILLVPGWQSSKGTLKELDRAIELGIPVYHSIEELRGVVQA